MYLNPGGGPQMNPGGPMQQYQPSPINPILALIQRMGGAQRRVDPGAPFLPQPHQQAPGPGPQHGHLGGGGDPQHGNLDNYTDAYPGFDPHNGGNPAHGDLAAIVAALGANHGSLDSFQGGGAHSNFLEGLHPAAQQAVLKLIQRMNLGHMPVGVDAQGHTRPGYHSQSTHRANVAAGRTHVLKAY